MAMPFHELRERLLRAGVAPRHVRRYLRELGDHLADLTADEERAGKTRADAESAGLARLGNVDDLAKAMVQQRQFQSWSARVPWAIFSIGSLLTLGTAYLLACVYLWCGWRIFLPGADTPFIRNTGPIYDLENIYFQAGKLYYELLPVLVALGIAFMAVRQRIKIVWPMIASALIAWMGATAQIQASRTLVPGLGHISMKFFILGQGDSLVEFRLLYALAIFTIGLLPYILWRMQRRVFPA